MFMRIKKFLLLIPFVVLIISLLIVNKKEEKLILLLGDNAGIKPHLGMMVENYLANDSLTLETMKSKDLAYYITSDASVTFENKKKSVSQLIKRSEFVVLSIGINDLYSKLILNKYEKKINYDLDSIEIMLNILNQNLSTILEKILFINKDVKILISMYDCPFNDLNDKNFEMIFEMLNSLMNSKYLEFNTFLLENKLENLGYYDDEFSIYLNDAGKRKIAENIYQKIIAITT